ncbi:hypothetical protein F5146DRAFT_925953, partial [Armillaria mellea]
STMLSIIVGPVRYVLGILFLLNIRAFPLAWHGEYYNLHTGTALIITIGLVRVLWPYFAFHIHCWLHGLSLIYKSTSARHATTQAWWDSRSPIGKSPFDLVLKYTDWSSVGCSRLYCRCFVSTAFYTWEVRLFSFIFLHLIKLRSLTSFLFMREIPILRRFEVRCSVVTWGEKWLYLVAKFVTTGSRRVLPRTEDTTPFSSPGTPYDSDADLQRKTPYKLSEEPDGAVVHCVSISQVCFKIGRITVPPAPVLTLSGCSDENYTRSNPPPGYLAAQKAVAEGQAKDLLKGGWKRVPKSERWWEGSFGEGIEKTRAEWLSVMEDIRLGMQRANAY